MYNPIKITIEHARVHPSDIVLATYDYFSDCTNAYILSQQDLDHIVAGYNVEWYNYLSMSSEFTWRDKASGNWEFHSIVTDGICQALHPLLDFRNRNRPMVESVLLKIVDCRIDVLARLTVPTVWKQAAEHLDLDLARHYERTPTVAAGLVERVPSLSINHLVKRGFNLAVFEDRCGGVLAILFEPGTDLSSQIRHITSDWDKEKELFVTYMRRTGVWPCAQGESIVQASTRLSAKLARIPTSLCQDYEEILTRIREELNVRHVDLQNGDINPRIEHPLPRELQQRITSFGLRAYSTRKIVDNPPIDVTEST